MSGEMPTSYLREKSGNIAAVARRLDARSEGGIHAIDVRDQEVDWLLLNAKAIVQEIETWRHDVEVGPRRSSVIVPTEQDGSEPSL